MTGNPNGPGVLQANITPSFLGFQPFEAENFIQFGHVFAMQSRALYQVTIGRKVSGLCAAKSTQSLNWSLSIQWNEINNLLPPLSTACLCGCLGWHFGTAKAAGRPKEAHHLRP